MKLLQSFGYAFKGLFAAVQSELNMKIHLLAVIIVVFAGFYFKVTSTEWALVLLCMALVIALELINTAIEKLLNKLHPEFDETIGLAKDISASAVLFASIIAVIIGGIVFVPYLLNYFFSTINLNFKPCHYKNYVSVN
jgi:diacylglycerol kinase